MKIMYLKPHFYKLLVLLIMILPKMAWAQSVTISGKVTSDAGEGLPGVNVLLKGTSNGTTTNAEGAYSFNVPEASGTLVFSYIGFTTEEVPINARSVIDVQLLPDIQTLGEVVVIGYGEREKKDVTGAISSVSSKEISSLPITSADQALQGRASGVQVTTTSGDPGARQVVRIRGVGTTGNADPLYVIDGVPVTEVRDINLQNSQNPLALINPADIESIDVLKDASAAAIYGVRAANGVIIITTKKGKAGRTTASFDMYRGIQQVRKRYDLLDTPGYLSLLNDIFTNAGDTLSVEDPAFDPANANNLLGTNTDWQKAIIQRNAPIENYNLNVSGGTEKATVSVSAGYFRQEAIVPKRGLERYSFGINSDVKPGRLLRFGQTLRLGYTKQNTTGQTSLGWAAGNPPVQRIYNDTLASSYGYQPSNAQTGGLGFRRNLIAIENINDSRLGSFRALGSVYAEIEPVKNLKIRGNLGMDYSRIKGIRFGRNDDPFGPGQNTPTVNTYGESWSESFNILKEVTINYTRTFGQHTLNALVGGMDQRFDFYGIGAAAQNLPSNAPELRFFSLAPSANQGAAENFRDYWALQGYIGRLSYSFGDKYYLDATIRRDGSSRFAPGYRWGTFPSFAAAWRISGENFMDNISFLSDLKLRAGWGQLGNQDIGSFAYVSGVNFNPQYYLGGNRARGSYLPNFPVRDITWEISTQTNIGLDAGFFDNKLTLTADYYIKNTDDILIGVPLPLVSGITSRPTFNAVSVENKGIELALGYRATTGAFTYGASANLTTVRNEVTSLGINGEPITNDYNRTELGKPVGYFYGFQTNGIFQNDGQVEEYESTIEDNISNDAEAGDIRFVDNNGPKPENSPRGVYFSGQPDGKVDDNDKTYLGKPIPDFYYGLTLDAAYKGFDFSIFLQGVQGIELYNGTRVAGEQMSGSNNQWASTANRWRGENTSNTMPRAVRADPNSNNRYSDRWIEDASFLRGRNIQLGYTLPVSLLTKVPGITNVRIYASVQNFFVITKYTGLDPEFSGRNVLENGEDVGSTPPPTTMLMGLNVTF